MDERFGHPGRNYDLSVAVADVRHQIQSIWTHRQKHKQSDRQTNKQTITQTNLFRLFHMDEGFGHPGKNYDPELVWTGRQTDRQTDRHTNKQTNKQTFSGCFIWMRDLVIPARTMIQSSYGQADRQTDIETNKQTNKQTKLFRLFHMDEGFGHPGNNYDPSSYGQADRQTDRQTNKQTTNNKQTNKQTNKPFQAVSYGRGIWSSRQEL